MQTGPHFSEQMEDLDPSSDEAIDMLLASFKQTLARPALWEVSASDCSPGNKQAANELMGSSVPVADRKQGEEYSTVTASSKYSTAKQPEFNSKSCIVDMAVHQCSSARDEHLLDSTLAEEDSFIDELLRITSSELLGLELLCLEEERSATQLSLAEIQQSPDAVSLLDEKDELLLDWALSQPAHQ